MLVDRALTKLKKEYPQLTVEKVDILTQPGRALKDGVKMIPTLKAGDKILSGIFLTSSRIRDFIQQQQ